MNKKFIVSTTNSLEGYQIKAYYGVCSERLVTGTGLFSEFFAGFTDIFGGRSGKYEARLKEVYDAAMEKLIKSATKKGANALIGLKMDMDEISGKDMQMFMITVSGTAVLVNSLYSNEEANESQVNKTLSRHVIANHIKQKDLSTKLEFCTSNVIFNTIIKEACDHRILLPLELIIKSINKDNLVKSYTYDETFNLLNNYLEMYDKDEVNSKFYELITQYKEFTDLFKGLFLHFAFPDYRLLQYTDSFNSDVRDTIILPVLLKYKESYDNNDIILIDQIRSKLNDLINTETTNITKEMFNKDVWICSCGKKVPMDKKRCDCSIGKNGLTNNQQTLIQEVIDFLTDIEEIFNSYN